MAIKIVDVQITIDYGWRDVQQQADWNSVKNSKANWSQINQTSIVGRQVDIVVEIQENTWDGIKDSFTSWLDIKNRVTNWLNIKNR